MLIQLFAVCCLILLSQEPVSSLRRKLERVLAVQLCAQNLEGGEATVPGQIRAEGFSIYHKSRYTNVADWRV